jgi:hypothetical protein
MQAGAGTNTMRDGHKKAPPKAGPEKESGLQSGLGRRDQRSGDLRDDLEEIRAG